MHHPLGSLAQREVLSVRSFLDSSTRSETAPVMVFREVSFLETARVSHYTLRR